VCLANRVGRLSVMPDLIRYERLMVGSKPDRSVLFVTNMWPDERRPYYGSFIASQARSLCEVGVAVDVLYVRGFIDARAYLSAAVRLPRIAQPRRYDVVHMHYGHIALSGVGVQHRPVVTSFCGEDLLGTPAMRGLTLKSRIEVATFRQVARLATATITKSVEMEQVLPPAVRNRNHVLPNGVDLNQFAPRSQEEARKELGWTADERILLFLGNPCDPRKNVGLARDAVSRLRGTEVEARLHEAWEVDPEQVPTLMNAADCLVFPSQSEGSPNAVKEAMACELPIVATPVGDVPARLQGVLGCHVRDPSSLAFAEAIAEVLRGGRAPEARRAIEALSLERVAVRLIEIYDEAEAVHHARRQARRWRPNPSGNHRERGALWHR
jgi:glycosyltransferase involved in cell wall biosynthesis